ncbi:hypothetical protein BDN67DRAFT_985177 [Paxillus ammoniavirescens]|nr:hypothetical protein BDN67DRAFT_985177 [Paxillus ammoniavirescens]
MLTILWPLPNLMFLSLNPCTVALQSDLSSSRDQRLTPRQRCLVLGHAAQSPQPLLLTSLPRWPVINPWTSEETVCRYCKKAHNTNPVVWTQTYSKGDHTFQYSPNTGTSALRGHINHHHILEYLTLVEVNKWQVWLESVKAVMA